MSNNNELKDSVKEEVENKKVEETTPTSDESATDQAKGDSVKETEEKKEEKKKSKKLTLADILTEVVKNEEDEEDEDVNKAFTDEDDELEEPSIVVPKEKGNTMRIESFSLYQGEDKYGDPIEALDVTFKDTTSGGFLRNRMFAPKRPKDIKDIKERKMVANNIKSFKHLFNALYPKGETVTNVEWNDEIPFTDFLENLVSGMVPDFTKVKAKVKVIYDKRGYTRVANFVPYIVTDLSNKQIEFVYDKKYDLLVKPEKKADSEDEADSSSGDWD